MAYLLADRIKQTSTSTGTGNFLLDGSVTGYKRFRDVLGVGDITSYCITDGVDWEVGECVIASYGTYPDSTIKRFKIIASSNANAAVNWGAGVKEVFITQPARKLPGNGRAFAFASGRYNT